MATLLASENIRFSSLFAAGDVSRNVPSGEERGETDVFAGYHTSGFRLREMFGYQAAIGVCIAVLSLQFS